MNSKTFKPRQWLPLLLILGVAAFLRFYRLSELPPGLHYDEAANGILSAEIAAGRSFPLFIGSYTGKEALYFYLAAGWMKLLGVSVWSLRFTSAALGLLTVCVTWRLVNELLADQDETLRSGVALFAAALIAASFWHVAVSRYGFRAISQPLTQALTLIFLWQGARDGKWQHLALGGVFCGLTAYTYLASRVVPLALIPWVVGLWLAYRGERRQITLRLLIFGLVAAVVAAPLFIFFIHHPEAFGTRMGQVSLFNPELNQGNVWQTLWYSVKAAFGMFTVRGDPQARFGIVGRPVFDPVIGFFFYLGLLASLYRAVRSPRPTDRVSAVSMLLWLPLLLVPNILGVKQVPHSLRAIGVLPILFYFPALGIGTALQLPGRRFARLRWIRSPTAALIVALLILAGEGAATGWNYFAVWGTQAQPYYENDGDMAAAAHTLNQRDLQGRDVFVSSIHYRHPTMAFLAHEYDSIRWLVGVRVLTFPPPDGAGALYLFPRSAMPDSSLLEHLEPVAARERRLGPDGSAAYLLYDLPAHTTPPLAPQHPAHANLGNQIELIGYDLPPVAAGETLKVTLYWRVLAPPQAPDVLAFAHLRDAWGLQWGSADPFDYPSEEWESGQTIIQQLKIPVPDVAPPGDFELKVGMASRGQDARLPLLDERGRMAGTAVHLGPVAIGPPTAPPAAPPDIPQPLDVDFAGLELLGLQHDQTSLRPGDTLYLGLYWRATSTLPDLETALDLRPVDGGDRIALWRGRPVHDTSSTAQWEASTLLLDRYGLRIPTATPAGDYTLTLTVLERDSGLAVSDPLALTTVDIAQVDRRTVAPPTQHPLHANLGDQVELLGYDLNLTQAAPGDALHLTLYWRALAEMDTSYTVFTHLLDGDEHIRGQQDNPPVGGAYPTSLWMVGEVVVDEYDIAVDADALPGPHVIEVGMYDPADLRRLPILDSGGAIIGNRVVLEEIQITGKE